MTGGFLSPRRSRPTDSKVQKTDRKENYNKINQRISSTPRVDSSDIQSSSRHHHGVNNNIESSISAPPSTFATLQSSASRTTKPAIQTTASKKTGKAVVGSSRGKSSVGTKESSSRKYHDDSPTASPSHFPTSGKVADPVLYNQLQQFSIDDGKDNVMNNILHTNSLHESVHSDTKDQNNFESYTPTILSRIYDEIASHRQGNTTIKSYYKNLKALWDESAPKFTDSLDAIDEEQIELMEREKVMHFLLGINTSYSSIASQILRLRPFPTVVFAYNLIIREQKNRKLAKKNTI